MGKKYARLYDRVFEALHAADTFVVVSDKTHAELVDAMADAMREAHISGRRDCADLPFWPRMAEAALVVMQASERTQPHG